MNEEDLKAITESIEGKIGDENKALIADDLGQIISSNNNMIKSLSEKDNEIKNLKDTNEKLVLANSKLLQQIPMAPEPEAPKAKEPEEKKSFNFKSMFDEHGNFKEEL